MQYFQLWIKFPILFSILDNDACKYFSKAPKCFSDNGKTIQFNASAPKFIY